MNSGFSINHDTKMAVSLSPSSHQITALVLSKLQQEAWESVRAENEEVSFEEWKQTMIKNCPTFQYWDLVLEFEILALLFIRAHHINDFNLYLESLKALTPWFFCLRPYQLCMLDSNSYSRYGITFRQLQK